MRIVNVIEIIEGILSTIESFVIEGSDDTGDPATIKQVKRAEELFGKLAEENGCDDIESAIEQGNL